MEKANTGRKKIFHAKSRSGCLTCRARRIKCDETRPTCLRCRKSRLECRGFEQFHRERSKECSPFAVEIKALVPPRPTQLLRPAANFFATNKEYHYFSLFSNKIAAEISPSFGADVWSRTILQACTSEPAIRHAAIAISALSKSMEATRDGKYKAANWLNSRSSAEWEQRLPPTCQEKALEARAHHQYALEQYGKAIERMRKDIAQGRQSLRITLISCIVIVCFDALHGNHESATMQLHHGIRIIQDWMRQHRESSKYPLGFSSPDPHVVEDFLLQTFGRLEIQVISFFDNMTPESHHLLRMEGKETIEKMPEHFSSLDEARLYLDLIMRRVMHTSASLPIRFRNPAHQSPAVPHRGSAENALLADSTWPLSYKEDTQTPQPVEPNPSILTERDSLLGELEAWWCSFETVLRSAIQKGGADAISALTMHVQQQTSSLFRSGHFTTEMQFDTLFPVWRTIVCQSSKLLAIQDEYVGKNGGGTTLGFAFDSGVIPCLYFTAIKCRDGPTRREALHLLQIYPRREGVWDSIVSAAVSAWVIDLEGQLEEGADDVVPEEKRVSVTNVKFNLLERTVYMTCLQMDLETRSFVERSHVHTW